MIRIQQVKAAVGHTREELEQRLLRELKLSPEKLLHYEIRKQSVDARKRPIQYVYTIDVQVKDEQRVLKHAGNPKAALFESRAYSLPKPGRETLNHPPVIIGSGPCGLFCGLMLARAGYCPIILERGKPAPERKRAVDTFWNTGCLDLRSNVQFGEGGAGTFSDGKLNTLVKDPAGRNRLVLKTFVEAGAPEEILWQNKPHLGTDLLIGIVENIRRQIEALGGQIRFESRMTDIKLKGDRIRSIRTAEYSGGQEKSCELETDVLVLAPGHSARDTYEMLKARGIPMEPKPFAVGVRIEHPQEMINLSQYGTDYVRELPAASYKLTRKIAGGRGVYSFCMCPGGYVVNASSETGRLAVNGMSYQRRDGRNANSAMVVTVGPKDFGGTDVLSGMEFQRRLEEAAYRAGEGSVPVQLFRDYQKNEVSRSLGAVEPAVKGAWSFGDVRGIFPEELAGALEEGILGCEQLLAGFSREDAVLSGVESRTSAPVRILRNQEMESAVGGLYPCGEGAGYAGGITSAAMDGVKAAEAIISRYAVWKKVL
ncbi:MAG: FAD-dependent oxidoreductase [Lachnospiraceae bacterium]|nr:FAD-dependent oxidoreductase [Lachnospiraceae bacterium]